MKAEGGDGVEEGAAGFETIVEMAARTRGMKERISEMEGELERRRGEAAEEGETNLDADGEEGEEEEEEDSVSTSYHMAGTDVGASCHIIVRTSRASCRIVRTSRASCRGRTMKMRRTMMDPGGCQQQQWIR